MKRIFLIAVLGLGVSATTSAASFSFGSPVRLSLTRNNAGSVAIGDANGDGRMDLAVTQEQSSIEVHQLLLYLQRADGSLAPPVKMPLPIEWGWALPVAFADLDHDGTEEILVGMSQLLVVRFSGGALATAVSTTVKWGCAYLASGDIDSDGNTDIVCHSGLGNPTSSTLFYGNGAGTFRSIVDMLTDDGSWGDDPGFKSLQLADVTGDGRLDLLITSSKVGSFFVYPNNQLGGFSPTAKAYPHPSSATGVWPSALQVLDLDGDGANEVVTASPGHGPDSTLNIYRRGSDGSLALSERSPIYDSTTALLAGSLDGDGGKELLAGHFGLNAVTVVGAGDTGVRGQARYDLPGFGNGIEHSRLVGSSNALALGDLNGDGCNDLAGATYSGVILLYGCRPFANRLPISDFDGDGVSDLYWRLEDTGENHLWLWASSVAWLNPTLMGSFWVPRVIGDFDGDGNSDMFWRNTATGANEIVASGFYRRPIAGVSSQDWQVVGAGDFDGDDRSDLLWRNKSTGANVIWKSANRAKLQSARGVTDLQWKVVGVGDFNGDGQSDVLWRHSASGRNAIWLSGRFETPQAMTAVTDVRWKVAGVGDINADGRDDVVWRHTGTGRNAIWLSANSATPKAVTGVFNLGWNIAAVGDYNGDLHGDLMWRNGTTGANVIWISADSQQQKGVSAVPTQLEVVR